MQAGLQTQSGAGYTNTFSATIPIATTTSAAIPAGFMRLVNLLIPADFTGTSISFLVSFDGGTTFQPLNDSTGALVVVPVTAGSAYAMNQILFDGISFLQIVSNATEVAQRTIVCNLKG